MVQAGQAHTGERRYEGRNAGPRWATPRFGDSTNRAAVIQAVRAGGARKEKTGVQGVCGQGGEGRVWRGKGRGPSITWGRKGPSARMRTGHKDAERNRWARLGCLVDSSCPVLLLLSRAGQA